MADCNKSTKQVEVTTTKDVTVVNLELSVDEARALSALLYSAVAGNGPVRDHTKNIGLALRKAGYKYTLQGRSKVSANVTDLKVTKEYDDYWTTKFVYDDKYAYKYKPYYDELY